MNAVNLIPSDSRSGRVSLSTSPPTLALLAGLVIVLIAAVLYVSAVNDVTARKSELARVTAGAVSWHAAANGFASAVQDSQQRTEQLADVQQLAAGRFPWSQLLSQIGGMMPAAAALTSLQATTTPATNPSVPPVPTVTLSGCAASQSTVAQTMVQLHRVVGVSAVTLSSSTDSGAGAAPSGGTSGGCPYPVVFQVSLAFGTPSAPAATTSATAPTATGPTTTPGTAPAASAPTTSTTAPAQ
jgi:Tfp pilus assembly protein PilN